MHQCNHIKKMQQPAFDFVHDRKNAYWAIIFFPSEFWSSHRHPDREKAILQSLLVKVCRWAQKQVAATLDIRLEFEVPLL